MIISGMERKNPQGKYLSYDQQRALTRLIGSLLFGIEFDNHTKSAPQTPFSLFAAQILLPPASCLLPYLFFKWGI